MISFRLTTEEYERFRELCYSSGIRSVSEMARAAIKLMFAQPERASQGALEVRVAELEGRFHMLALEVRRLSEQAVQSASASSAGGDG
jgi:uncharacterized small protein (DUF1192 family)